MEVPEALRGYRVEEARAKDYDWLLEVELSEAELSEARQERPHLAAELAAELEGGS
ncbi:MAG: hypothetical protein LC674_06765 [Actinobacteria bacterium]|nr:hypothetical protein [Actinomycetota bacterium]